MSFAHVQCLFRFWLRMRTVWIWNDSSKSLSVLCGGLPVWGRASIAYQIHSPRVNSRFHRKNKKWTHIIHNSVDVVDRINVISFVGSQYIYIFSCTWSYLFRGKGRHGRYDLAATISHRRSNKHIWISGQQIEWLQLISCDGRPMESHFAINNNSWNRNHFRFQASNMKIWNAWCENEAAEQQRQQQYTIPYDYDDSTAKCSCSFSAAQRLINFNPHQAEHFT